LTGPAKILDHDTNIVAEQLVSFTASTSPSSTKPSRGEGSRQVCGMVSLAALSPHG
jgi:hypothetical protein